MKMEHQQSLASLKGWKQSYLPIACGAMPPETITLAALADSKAFGGMVPHIASAFDADMRYASLTLLHYAIGAVANLLIAPLALDGVTVDTNAEQLGMVVQENGSLTDLWVASEIRFRPERNVAEFGACLIRILEPIVAAAQATIPLKGRGVHLVMYDAIYRSCQSLERAHDIELENGWIQELLAAMGNPDDLKYRTFVVQPDDGSPVEMTIPRVCCVLHKRAMPNACPTCPKYSDQERIAMTTDWLRSLDDVGFREATGRARVCGAK